MHKIEYEIKLNDHQRPCIDLPKEYEDKPEDKFFAIELARYFLQTTHSRMTPEVYDQYTIDEMDRAIRLLGQIGDEMAHLMWDSMKTMGEVSMMYSRWQIKVLSVEELNSLPDTIVYDSKIYMKQNGLKALVEQDQNLYEFNEGIWNIYGTKQI